MEAKRKPRWRPWRPPEPTKDRWGWTGFTGKTLWDWLQLLSALAIPVVLAAAGFWFSAQQDQRQQRIENQRAGTERTIEEQRAQDAALQAYLDQMSQLMLEEDLRGSEAGSEVRTLARARTQTILARVDGRRKRTVVQFLYEAFLLERRRPVVSLSGVRLRGADLSALDLSGANLSGADLRGVNLSGVDLSDADVSEADLTDTDLSFASMSGTNLSGSDLDHANLREVDLIEADLSGADVRFANVSDAILRDADLREAYLIGTDLSDANLSNADMSDAYLIEIDLSDADLTGADMSGASGVTDGQLEEQARTLQGATMPDGTIHP